MRQIVLACCMAVLALPALAEDDAAPPKPALAWQEGPCDADLVNATLKVPEGYRFVPKGEMPKLLQMTENLSNGHEVGALLPAQGGWILWFDYDASGYVKDDEKDKLDADAMLKAMKENDEESNEARKAQGWGTITTVGWDHPPFYDPDTHLLTWALRLRAEQGGDCVNYNSRVLGRRGVMSITLSVDPDKLEAAVPVYKSLLTGFAFKPGETYAEFTTGDRVAEYGLIALVGGGSAIAAAKMGLFGKLWKLILAGGKFIILGAVALFAGIKKLFRKKEPPPGAL